jgi:formylglycine-generating enzyme required for sulfatase activity
VPGGTFNRSNDAQSSATVSSFHLDAYEVTVGRFKRFVAAYAQDMISTGAGKNPNNSADQGWDPTWNAELPQDAAELKASLRCDLSQPIPSDDIYGTWAGGNDNLPINCVDWYVAYAFCIWDGGRLPTEAEWNYAAAGGMAQREYPWGNQQLGADSDLAAYGCYYHSNGTCMGLAQFAPVGTIANNHTLWGQFDMAGNLWEWTRDGYDAYVTPCIDCAQLGATTEKVYRGGGFVDNAEGLTTMIRGHYPSHASHNVGIRCARSND